MGLVEPGCMNEFEMDMFDVCKFVGCGSWAILAGGLCRDPVDDPSELRRLFIM